MSSNRNKFINILVVAMSFGTAWAIRGQFGHEQGAAWAAGIGGLAMIMVSERKDWYQRLLPVTLASAIGWGMGGMMSYGAVVGYGRSDDFVNAAYGLLMLFVIGGLYGLIGGGLTGLTLESSGDKKVNWGVLMAEMVAGGLVAYGFLIMQLEILMTPPRSEAWAFCFGAGLALVWHMARKGYKSSLKVAFVTMIGSGFGFAFGNFLQIVGNLLEIKFNMWNVMEYSIGFFGGLALAYSVFTTSWPQKPENPKPWENRVSYIIALIFIPFIVFQQSLSIQALSERFSKSGNIENFASLSSIVSGLLISLVVIIFVVRFEKMKFYFTKNTVLQVYLLFIMTYTTVSFIVTGLFAGIVLFNHVLYLVNVGVVLVLTSRIRDPFTGELNSGLSVKHFRGLAIVLILIVLLSLFLVNIHGELGGVQMRFK